MPPKRTVYLDYSASTPTDLRVVEAMMPYFTEVFGNASSAHSFGRKAEDAIENARRTVARRTNDGVRRRGKDESDATADQRECEIVVHAMCNRSCNDVGKRERDEPCVALILLLKHDSGCDHRQSERRVERQRLPSIPSDRACAFRRENVGGRRRLGLRDRAERVVSAQVDPRRVLLLDAAYTNNSRTLEPRSREASLGWAARWMVWLQDLMVTYAFFL